MRYILLLFLGMALIGRRVQAPVQDKPTPTKVIIGSAAVQTWALLYREFKTEFMECLYGGEVDDSVHVQWAMFASVRPSQVHVDGVEPPIMCPNMLPQLQLVGIAHSHPSGNCGQSEKDLRTLVRSGLAVSIIICSQTKFTVYRRGEPLGGVRCTFDAEVDDARIRCAAAASSRPAQ